MISKLARLCEAQNWRCCYCGVAMLDCGPAQDDRAATIEHVRPRSIGGANQWENVVAACRLCNEARGDMDPKDYLFLLGSGDRKCATKVAWRIRRATQSIRSQERKRRVALMRSPTGQIPAVMPTVSGDPMVQEAFTRVYAGRLHMLRV